VRRLNVRFGSLADITARWRHVRFTPNSGHLSVRAGWRLVPIADSAGHYPLRYEKA
jgi:hypothetical protein